MAYLFLNKIRDNYYILNCREIYDFNIPSGDYGLLCKLDSSYEELTSKAGGLYCKVAEQAIEPNTLLKGCKAFRKEEIGILINKALSDYLDGIDPLEKAISAIRIKEAENYLSSKGSYQSDFLKFLASANSVKVDDIAELIIAKSKEHEQKLISFKCRKDYLISELEYIDTLEGFESFDIEAETETYLKGNIKAGLEPTLKYKKEDIEAAVEAVSAKITNKKKSAKQQSEEKQQDVVCSQSPNQELKAK